MTQPLPVSVSVLSRNDLGALVLSGDATEETFKALVAKPVEAVADIIGDASWRKEHDTIVSALAAAPDKKARDQVKRRLPALVPARFKRDRRLAAECEGRQVVMHDFDTAPGDSFDDACDRIRAKLPDRFLALHTTATERNEDGSWRLRAIEILDREATPKEWEERVQPHMRSLAGYDKQALDIARLLYMPVKTANYGYKVYPGPRTKLESLPVGTASKEPAAGHAPNPGVSAREDAAKVIGKYWPPPGARADARLALAGACARAGWPMEESVAFVQRVHAHVADVGTVTDGELEALVRTAYGRVEKGETVWGMTELSKHLAPIAAEKAEALFHGVDVAGFKALSDLLKPPPPAKAKPDSAIFWDNWDEPLPPVAWLVEGLIPKGTVGAFVAHGSSLKTWTMLSIGAAIAQGKPWLGKFPVRRGKVIVLDYESGRYELRRRVLLIEGGKVVGLGAWSYPEKRIDDPTLWDDLQKEEGVALVCVDSLAEGSSPGVDENSKEAAFPLQLAAKYTEDSGASVLFVHHSKKDDSGDARKVVRGSTAIYAALDWCFAFENVEETTKLRRMRMVSIKPCMGAKPEPVPLELTDKGLGTFDVKQKTTKDSTPEQIQAAICLRLSAGPIETKAKLAKDMGIRREIIGPEVDALVVRRDVVFLKGQGYALDSDERRRERVVETVGTYQHWRAIGQIAKAANVDPQDVQAAKDAGAICQSGDGRFLVISR